MVLRPHLFRSIQGTQGLQWTAVPHRQTLYIISVYTIIILETILDLSCLWDPTDPYMMTGSDLCPEGFIRMSSGGF